MGKKLIASNPKNVSNKQHQTPCSDCPWRRDALPGWLGSYAAADLVQMAHGEFKYNCHVIVNQQCAGMAVYRSNVVKQCRDASILRLPANRTTVFANPNEFLNHHHDLRSDNPVVPQYKPKR